MATPLTVAVCVRAPEPGAAGALSTLDLRALERALSVARTAAFDVTVVALSAGGQECLTALRECMARGADRSLHVATDQPLTDSLGTARLLAGPLSDIRPDLILAGTRSEVGMHGATSREIARLLDIPYLGSAVDIKLGVDGDRVQATVVQRLERGDTWAWGCSLPMVCAVERDISAPRYLAVRRLRRMERFEPAVVRLSVSELLTQVEAELGTVVVEARTAPRIRPKKTKVTVPATMSAGDRMKALRGGPKAAAVTSEDDGPKRVSGEPADAAAEILKLLEKLGLLKS